VIPRAQPAFAPLETEEGPMNRGPAVANPRIRV
jgi:hypothetical protein